MTSVKPKYEMYFVLDENNRTLDKCVEPATCVQDGVWIVNYRTRAIA